MGDGHAPVGRDFPQRSSAEAGILRVVEIFLDQAGIVGIEESDIAQIGGGLKTGAQRADRDAVRTDGAGRAEARAVTQVLRALHIVDVTALVVEIEDAA